MGRTAICAARPAFPSPMYHLIDRWAGCLLPTIGEAAERASACPIVWNPPGWGSYSSLSLRRDFPFLEGSWRLAMILAMKPGSYIPFHVDNPAAENAVHEPLDRYHVVLATNRACWNFHDGTWQQLEVGGIYQMDPFKEHASINLGETVRFHLVVDIATHG